MSLSVAAGGNSSVDSLQRGAVAGKPKATNCPAIKFGNFQSMGLTFIIFMMGDT